MERLYRRRAVLLLFVFIAYALPVAAQSGAVRGNVQDIEGRPVKGAAIRATNPNVSPGQLTATTDDKGRFALIGLMGGMWTFVAEAPGYVAQQGMARIRSSTTGNPPLEFTLARTEVPVPGALDRQIQAEIASADDLRNSGRLDQAISAYEEIAAKNPTLTLMQLVIADAYRQKAAKESNTTARQPIYDRAIASYRRVLKDEPENDRARIELANTFTEKGSFDEAERLLAAPAESPTAAREVVFALGEVRFAKGDLSGAEVMFQRASTIDPAWLGPRLKLGLIAFRRGSKDAALALFRAIVASGPSSAEAIEAGTYLQELAK